MGTDKWYSVPAEEVVKSIGSHLEHGLTAEQAKERLEQYGPNALKGKERETIWQMLLEQFKDFLVLILIAASVVSALLGEVTDAVVIIIIVIINAILGVVQENRASKALEALQRMAAPMAKVIRDGHQITVPARELVPGDLVLLEAGDYVPADMRLVESVNLKIEEAALTGESVPAEKNADAVFAEDVPLGDRDNSAFMGTIVTYGRGKGLVVATGMNTQIGLIAEMLESYEEGDTPLQQKLAQLGKYLGLGVLAICAIVFVTGLVRGENPLEMFMVAVSLAVAAIPEGLPAIVTIVLALGMQKMVSRHAIIKKLHAVETLGSTTTICSDKTGTLTQNQMTAVRAYAGGRLYTITGEGYRPRGEFFYREEPCDPTREENLRFLLTAAALCNDAKLEESGEQPGEGTQWRLIGDPTEGALVVAAAKAGLTGDLLNQRYPRRQEIPFDSDRKRMTTINARPDAPTYYAFVKGAPDVVLALCTRIYENGQVRPMTEEDRAKILDVNGGLARQALRVLAVAYRDVECLVTCPTVEETERELTFIGLIGMIDPPRPEAIAAIKVCKQAGIRPVMITGDHKDTAVAIAQEMGLMRDPSRVMTGTELDALSSEELRNKVMDTDVYARVSPQNKMQIVEALKSNGQIVAMTGDGVNDAPALKRADIGVAMGITGTDVTKETAHMILTDDNFASIVAAVEEGRIIYSNIRKFIFFLLSCNVGEVMIIFFAMLLNLPIPLIPIQLLWINLLTDAFPALALGMEKGEPDIMRLKPRNPAEPILDRIMQWGIAIQSSVLTIATLGAFVYALHAYAPMGEHYKIEMAHSIAFVTLTVAELLRAYTSRSERYSVFQIGMFSNKYMVGGTLLSFVLILATIYIPPLRPIFGTEFMGLREWGIVFGFAVLPFIAAEISKIFIRRSAVLAGE